MKWDRPWQNQLFFSLSEDYWTNWWGGKETDAAGGYFDFVTWQQGGVPSWKMNIRLAALKHHWNLDWLSQKIHRVKKKGWICHIRVTTKPPQSGMSSVSCQSIPPKKWRKHQETKALRSILKSFPLKVLLIFAFSWWIWGSPSHSHQIHLVTVHPARSRNFTAYGRPAAMRTGRKSVSWWSRNCDPCVTRSWGKATTGSLPRTGALGLRGWKKGGCAYLKDSKLFLRHLKAQSDLHVCLST